MRTTSILQQVASLLAIVVAVNLASCAEPTDARPSRPQEPVRPFPYTEELITYQNPRASVTLAGTLTYPSSGGPFPTVLLILGSGRLTRDCVVADHKIFLVLADHLTRRGFAVLRVDKRGLGESTGDYLATTSNELADDVLAGVEYLKTLPQVDSKRLGLMGISEGGLLAPAVANATKDVSFVVALGGPAVPGERVLDTQDELIGRAQGFSELEIQQARTFIHQYQVFVRQGQSREQLSQRLDELLQQLPVPEAYRRGNVIAGQEVLTSPWYRFH
jgi:uncharacterized protein